MRMDRRAGLLLANRIPNLATVFAQDSIAKAFVSYKGGSSGAAGGVAKWNPPSAAAEGEVWYTFFCCGGSLEISRINFGASASMTKTRLSSTAASGETKQTTSISDGQLVTDNSIYAGLVRWLCFSKFSSDILDYVFSNCYKSYLKYYYGINNTANASDLRVLASTVTAKSGIALAAFVRYYNSTNTTVFSVTDSKTPTTPIQCVIGGSRITDRAGIYQSGSYLLPTSDGSTTAYNKAYTYVNLYEDW